MRPDDPSALTIVMYHYVRPIAESRFPRIKALDLPLFVEQLAYLRQHHEIIAMDAVFAAIEGQAPLPDRACLLTFDDGYRDHADHVAPLLAKAKLSGAFFAPCMTLLDRRLLDVNKIHFILAGEHGSGEIAAALDALLAVHGWDDAAVAALKAGHRHGDHLDDADTVYIKHLLQYALPSPGRHDIVDRLFARFVSVDEAGFAEELYLNETDARDMIAAGMHFGGHGDGHRWLTHISPAERDEELKRSGAMLLALGMPTDRLSFCYPYGDEDAAVRNATRAHGFGVAVTTRRAIARVPGDDPLALPRLDTIDLPRHSAAAVDEWVLAA